MNLESLPSLAVYIPSKKIYSTLVGTFDLENIMSYIQNVINGKTSLYNLDPNSIAIKDIKCEELKEEVQESTEDDEILREIIEEERKKREEYEKEREADMKKKGKKNKKKKGKKSDL